MKLFWAEKVRAHILKLFPLSRDWCLAVVCICTLSHTRLYPGSSSFLSSNSSSSTLGDISVLSEHEVFWSSQVSVSVMNSSTASSLPASQDNLSKVELLSECCTVEVSHLSHTSLRLVRCWGLTELDTLAKSPEELSSLLLGIGLCPYWIYRLQRTMPSLTNTIQTIQHPLAATMFPKLNGNTALDEVVNLWFTRKKI